jgi:hypothetical protein
MYQVDEKDTVVELTDVPQSDVGAPLPMIWSDENSLLLVYRRQAEPLHRIQNGAVLVTFENYASYFFGAPNDEAFSGHPLAERGLKPYGSFEVKNSSWVRSLERMNSAHPKHHLVRDMLLKQRHFVFSFHDSTFECVANRYTVIQQEGTTQDILLRYMRQTVSR